MMGKSGFTVITGVDIRSLTNIYHTPGIEASCGIDWHGAGHVLTAVSAYHGQFQKAAKQALNPPQLDTINGNQLRPIIQAFLEKLLMAQAKWRRGARLLGPAPPG
jgi:hypothetical protein